jgi:tetratricopeptide (TPR) repeat protein
LLEVVARYNLGEPRFVMEALRRSVHALRDGQDALPSAAAPPRSLESFGSRHFAHFSLVLEMQVHYLCGRYREAVEAGLRGNAFLADSKGMLHSAEHVLYLALARLASASSVSALRRRRTLTSTRGSLRRLERWAAGCPENFQAKALLLRGEWNAARGRYGTALEELERAARAALCYAQPHIAALAYQRSAFYAARQGDATQAEQLLQEAARLYEGWGALDLAARLRQQPTPESLAA